MTDASPGPGGPAASPRPVRTRVAPSPTGDPHVGTAYVALINYAYARRHGGQFVLRIEDTDQARSTPESEAAILASLRWLGLSWDEGPDVGGPHGPYRQSERSALYRAAAEQLIADGNAFRCWCSPAELEAMRKAQQASGEPPRYNGHCLHLPAARQQELLASGAPYTVRLLVPDEGVCTVEDSLRGAIEIAWNTVDAQVLLKSDGLPTYHLANVVDDHAMEISDVIRGEEWISSAPKHLLLYRYLGWQAPRLTHLPLLRNPDKSKLSKRKNPTGIRYFERAGYLPQALLNFLALLAHRAAEGEELFSLDRFVAGFDLSHISLGGPVFDLDKLDWLNARYLRETMDVEGFAAEVRRWALNPDYLLPIAAMAQSRITRLGDLGGLTAMFFMNRIDGQSAERLRDGVRLDADQQRRAYHLALTGFDALSAFDKPGVEAVLRAVAPLIEARFKDMIRPFYIAITGAAQSVPLFDAAAHLGRDIVRERLRHALELLGPVSKKEAQEWGRIDPATLAPGEPQRALAPAEPQASAARLG